MKKKRWIHYVVNVAIALVIFGISLYTQGINDKIGTKEAVRVLSDCFFFSGVLLGGVGVMSFVASEGVLDMLGYGFSYCKDSLFHPRQTHRSYYEYKMEKSEGTHGVLVPTIIVGAVCILGSVICAVIYG